MFNPIDLKEFERRTGIVCKDARIWPDAECIVSLRALVRIEDIKVMRLDYLERLMHSVTLVGDPSVKPYAGCKIRRLQFDPKQVSIGQTFLERRKCSVWIERHFDDLFQDDDIAAGPFHKRGMIILGRTADETLAVAHYLPPIVERHGAAHVLLDGVHRSYAALRTHPSLEAVEVSDVSAPLPFDLRGWEQIAVVDEKPTRDQRFFNLKPEYYRDLKHVGIDG